MRYVHYGGGACAGGFCYHKQAGTTRNVGGIRIGKRCGTIAGKKAIKLGDTFIAGAGGTW